MDGVLPAAAVIEVAFGVPIRGCRSGARNADVPMSMTIGSRQPPAPLVATGLGCRSRRVGVTAVERLTIHRMVAIAAFLRRRRRAASHDPGDTAPVDIEGRTSATAPSTWTARAAHPKFDCRGQSFHRALAAGADLICASGSTTGSAWRCTNAQQDAVAVEAPPHAGPPATSPERTKRRRRPLKNVTLLRDGLAANKALERPFEVRFQDAATTGPIENVSDVPARQFT